MSKALMAYIALFGPLPVDTFPIHSLHVELRGQERRVSMVDDQIIIPVMKGANPVLQYRSPPLVKECAKRFEVSASLAFSEHYEFAKNIEKLPVGLYGGETAKCISGGCPLENRDGFSVRLIEKAGTPGLYIYDDIAGLSSEGTDYGRTIYSPQIAMDTEEHRFTVGVREIENRYHATLQLNGEILIDEPMHIKEDKAWCPKGLLMTFMWGGPTNDPIHWSPKEQQILLKDVSVYAQ